MDSEDEEISLLCALLADERRVTKKRRFWVKNIYRNRRDRGTYETLVNELRLGYSFLSANYGVGG